MPFAEPTRLQSRVDRLVEGGLKTEIDVKFGPKPVITGGVALPTSDLAV